MVNVTCKKCLSSWNYSGGKFRDFDYITCPDCRGATKLGQAKALYLKYENAVEGANLQQSDKAETNPSRSVSNGIKQ